MLEELPKRQAKSGQNTSTLQFIRVSQTTYLSQRFVDINQPLVRIDDPDEPYTCLEVVRVHAMIPHLCLRALLPNSDRSPERTYSLCQICDLCGRVSLFDLRRGLRSFLQ